MTNPGRFVWYELLTSDVKGALAFYPEVIGWKPQPFGNDYMMFAGAQGPLGGVTKLPEQAVAMGAMPYWQANVEVANVDATVEKVKALGGKILVAEEVPSVGRFAVLADPQGAVIAAFTPSGPAMASHDVNQAGEFQWHELLTSDHEAAFSFYSAIFGWERLGEHDMGPMGKYLLWGREGKQLGGMMTNPGMKMPDGRPVPPNWMNYITTPDLDGWLTRAKSLGAKVINGPMEVPGGQRVVLMFDPQGAAFALVTPRTA